MDQCVKIILDHEETRFVKIGRGLKGCATGYAW